MNRDKPINRDVYQSHREPVPGSCITRIFMAYFILDICFNVKPLSKGYFLPIMKMFKKVYSLRIFISLIAIFMFSTSFAYPSSLRKNMLFDEENAEIASERYAGVMKNLSARSPEADLSEYHEYFVQRSLEAEEKEYYGIQAKITWANPDYFSKVKDNKLWPGAYIFYIRDNAAGEKNHIIVLNANYIGDDAVYEESVFYGARRIFWEGQGFTGRESHIIASAEQVLRFSKAGSLTPYHKEQLKAMSPEQFDEILSESWSDREEHIAAIEKANILKKTNKDVIFGSIIDLDELKNYGRTLRDPIKMTLKEKGDYNFDNNPVFAVNTNFSLVKLMNTFVQGIKIHVDIRDKDPQKTKSMLDAVLSVAYKYKLPHKVTNSLSAADKLKSSQAGKTVTFYMLRQAEDGDEARGEFLTNYEVRQVISELDSKLLGISGLESNSFEKTGGEVPMGESGRVGVRRGAMFAAFFANVDEGKTKSNLRLREISVDNRSYGNQFVSDNILGADDKVPEGSGVIMKRRIDPVLDKIFENNKFKSIRKDDDPDKISDGLSEKLNEMLARKTKRPVKVRPFSGHKGRNEKGIYLADVDGETWMIKIGDYPSGMEYGTAGTVWAKEFMISEKARDNGFLREILANNPVDFLRSLGREREASFLRESLEKGDWNVLRECVEKNFMKDGYLFTTVKFEKKTSTWRNLRGKKKLLGQLENLSVKLHDSGIVHRDIKPDNILVTTQEKKIRLIDFENAVLIEDGELLTAPLPMMTESYSNPWHVSDIYASMEKNDMARWFYFQDEFAFELLKAEAEEGFSYLEWQSAIRRDDDFFTEGNTLEDFTANPRKIIIVPYKAIPKWKKQWIRVKIALGLMKKQPPTVVLPQIEKISVFTSL